MPQANQGRFFLELLSRSSLEWASEMVVVVVRSLGVSGVGVNGWRLHLIGGSSSRNQGSSADLRCSLVRLMGHLEKRMCNVDHSPSNAVQRTRPATISSGWRDVYGRCWRHVCVTRTIGATLAVWNSFGYGRNRFELLTMSMWRWTSKRIRLEVWSAVEVSHGEHGTTAEDSSRPSNGL